MADHYYTRDPKVESSPIYWDTQLRNHHIKFKTDQGVFSKGEVDFGSRFMIEMFSPPDQSGPLLDAGCGYGPVGLTLAKEFANRQIHMIDVNCRAIQLSKENAILNHIENVSIYESDRFQGVVESRFAAILTNPPIRAGKQVVHDLLEQSFHHLLPGGQLWVVIQKKQGAPSAKGKLESIFPRVEEVGKRKGYYLLKATK